MRHLAIAILMAMMSSSALAETIADVELPPIPSKSSKPSTGESQTQGSSLLAKYRLNDAAPPDDARKPLELKVKPGYNEMVTIGRGYLNRIVTPFDNPVVRTSNTVETHKEGNVVYVTTNEEATATMFILDASGGPAISLSLLPRSTPPREVRLMLDDGEKSNVYIPSKAALATETQQPYVASMMDVLTSIARGKLPAGYRLTDPVADDHVLFYCPLPAVETDLRQVIEGSKWRVGVTRVRNNSHYPIEVRESDCQGEGRLATSMFPSAIIAPGEEAEMYLVITRDKPKSTSTRDRAYVFTR